MLLTRILTALALVPLVIAALFGLPPRGWALVALGFVGAAAWEWAALARWTSLGRIAYAAATAGLALALLFAPMAGFAAGWPASIAAPLLAAATLFWVALMPFWLRGRWQLPPGPAAALVGWLVLLPAWVALVQLQARSPWVVLAAMAIVWLADTAAYFAGRAFGRRKLAPMISPGKSWEGVYGGVIAVAVYAAALLPLARDHGYVAALTPAFAAGWIAMAIALALLSVGGDLFESLLKRHAGVKDSGRTLPGHGGVLDRIDALLAAMPPAALAAMVLLQ
ncbi:MAG: phosphatidate cytidylyltransferase [Betaproteobacteria bacterium]|nr:phosphatidate cytidylyltransferase [Betaproteobacteria bacterium]